jgi:hypothetical protein
VPTLLFDWGILICFYGRCFVHKCLFGVLLSYEWL